MIAEDSLFRIEKGRYWNYGVELEEVVDKFSMFSFKEWLDHIPVNKSIQMPMCKDLEHWLRTDERISYEVLNNVVKIKKNKDYDYGDEDEWSFIIITQGKRNHILKQLVESIDKQNIPFYEIIVVGGENQPYEGWSKKLKYIPFMEMDAKGWITRKKNVGVENSKYKNLCVLHDDLYLNDDWFETFKKWGNNFEVANLTISNRRSLSWFCECQGKNMLLEEGDWHWDYYIGGHCILLKRFVWEKVKWDEKLFWGRREDVYYTWALRDVGFLPRVSPMGVTLLE